MQRSRHFLKTRFAECLAVLIILRIWYNNSSQDYADRNADSTHIGSLVQGSCELLNGIALIKVHGEN